MYDYRRWTAEQREAVVRERRQHGYPWHGPPHPEAPGNFRIITAACFEHQPILATTERLFWFEQQLLKFLVEEEIVCAAWVLLPNHYHLLVQIDRMQSFGKKLGQLHGRTSFEMNREDGQRGRQVWFRSQDRCMRSESHFAVTLNYIHNNPVKHGYVSKWSDCPYSSVHWYLETKGRDWMRELWLDYPVLNYGEKWDP
jgi:putative transposase